MVIYENAIKKLEARRSESTGDLAFYLTREEQVYKLHDAGEAAAHIIRNLRGRARVMAMSKLLMAVSFDKLS